MWTLDSNQMKLKEKEINAQTMATKKSRLTFNWLKLRRSILGCLLCGCEKPPWISFFRSCVNSSLSTTCLHSCWLTFWARIYVCVSLSCGWVEMDLRELLHKSQILINCDRWFKDTENYVKLKTVIDIAYKPVFRVGSGGGGFGLFPNVVSAVELTPNSTMKTAKSIVKLPHCVNRLSGSICGWFWFCRWIWSNFNYTRIRRIGRFLRITVLFTAFLSPIYWFFFFCVW